MKFLILGKMKDIGLALPPALGRQLMEASVAVVNKQKKEGKIEQVYWIPGAGTSVSIGECKTAEELMRNLNEAPTADYFGFEISPLADFNESMKILVEKMKEAEKMMVSSPK